jgi:hypothetical protein
MHQNLIYQSKKKYCRCSGTKKEEYLLVMNERNKLKKAPYDKRFLTAAENTVKFPRNGRNKNENLHAG